MTIALRRSTSSPEELELLREVARGRSNAEIAEAAEIEEAVVGADLHRILATLQLRTACTRSSTHTSTAWSSADHATAACAGDSVYSSNEGRPIHGS